jgi:type I restriction enzyme M protein
MPDIKLRELITHFSTTACATRTSSSRTCSGAAYEYLIGEFADSAGKKGGEFYTPRSVVRMMVRLVKPEEQHSVYDPCCGSGGMLILSKEYIDEHGPRPAPANLYGQEAAGTVWSIAKMNMLLHGISSADLRNEDTLAEPQHVEGGELMRFDRVLTNPPFSINWGTTDKDRARPAFPPRSPERFRYGTGAPGRQEGRPDVPAAHGGRAQATAAWSPPSCPTACCSGAATRRDPRRHDRGRPDRGGDRPGPQPVLRHRHPGLHHPALRAKARTRSGKPAERQGKVLFINADREYFEGRAQNYLLPEHIEKIVTTFDEFAPVPGFSAIVDNEHAGQNDYNLNIRRYADNAPPPEPHDVRAHLKGGVPKAEVQAKAAPVRGPRPGPAWTCSPPGGRSGLPGLPAGAHARADLKPAIEQNPGLTARRPPCRPPSSLVAGARPQHHGPGQYPGSNGSRLSTTARTNCWPASAPPWSRWPCSTPLPCAASSPASGTRAKTTSAPCRPAARWASSTPGAPASSPPWRTSRTSPTRWTTSWSSFLLMTSWTNWNELEARKAELDSQIKAAEAGGEEDEDGESAGDEDFRGRPERGRGQGLEEATHRRDQTAQGQAGQLRGASQRSRWTPSTKPAPPTLLLTILHDDMADILERYVRAQRQQVIAAFETWWDKYRVTLADIEAERDAAARELRGFLGGLGYV